MSQPKYDQAIWLALLDSLKRARGNNQFRGRQTLLPLQSKVFLERELRENRPNNGYLAITVGNSAENTYFSFGNELVRLSECFDMDEFIARALSHCRHSLPYIRTYDSKTEYKPHPDGTLPQTFPRP
jgi:hypothetical protein